MKKGASRLVSVVILVALTVYISQLYLIEVSRAGVAEQDGLREVAREWASTI